MHPFPEGPLKVEIKLRHNYTFIHVTVLTKLIRYLMSMTHEFEQKKLFQDIPFWLFLQRMTA